MILFCKKYFHYTTEYLERKYKRELQDNLYSQADKEKKIKKKKSTKEEGAPAAEEAPAPAPAAAPAAERTSSRGSRKAAKRSGSNVFSMFSQKQVAEFKEVIIARRLFITRTEIDTILNYLVLKQSSDAKYEI